MARKNEQYETEELPVSVEAAPIAIELHYEPEPPAEAPKPNAFCVYIGPTVRGMAQSGQIFPGEIKDVKAKIPHPYSAFVVPSERLAESRIKIKTPGNLLYEQYWQVAGTTI